MADNVKIATSDSTCCESITEKGQCKNEKVGGKFCPVHNSLSNYHVSQRNIHSLKLAQFQARTDAHANDSNVKSLRGEIGVLRLILESTMIRCADDGQLVMASGRISDLVVKLEKLVSSCHKIEQNSSGTMDRAALLQFASQVVSIIGNHITDEMIIDRISNDILKVLGG